MNKKINLAVASAALVLGASAANAGIVIPAGEWTLDVNGNVNVYASTHNADDTTAANSITGGLATYKDINGESDSQGINTGLLPAWLGFTGTTRQNDLDVSFTISMQPNVSDNSAAGDSKTPLNRQAFITFGDKSWGTVKLGKDLGIFAAGDAKGKIWVSGAAYDVTTSSSAAVAAVTTTYTSVVSFTVSVIASEQGVTSLVQETVVTVVTFSNATAAVDSVSYDATVVDIGASVTLGNFGLTGYYYSGEGVGTTIFGANGATSAGLERDSDGGYVQATFVIPTGTKLGASYGISNLDLASGEAASSLLEENKRWTVGAYHPLTKHLNLVAEYNQVEASSHSNLKAESDSFSLGAILFF
jgi:predicted porin